MWVSKKKWDEVTLKLAALEQRVSESSRSHSFTVYKKRDPIYYAGLGMPPRQQISVKDVIDKILTKLGMELVYVDGQPERVEMKKASGK